MKKTMLLGAIGAVLLGSMSVTPAHARADQSGTDSAQANTRAGRRAQKGSQAAPAPLFPAATREEPKQEGSRSLNKKLTKLFALQEKEDYDKTINLADEIIADSNATPYDRSTASYFAGFAWASKDTNSYANAISYLKKAIEANGLNNNTHFQIMLQVAQMESNEEKYADALATIDKFLTETKSTDSKAWALKANVLYRMDRFADSAEAIKTAIAKSDTPDPQMVRMLVADYQEMDKPAEAASVLEGMLAKSPNDKGMMISLAIAYHDADNDTKSSQIIKQMQDKNLLTETKDYETAYRLLGNMEGKSAETVALINDGLAKGLLSPSYDVYAFIGNAYYYSDKIPDAITAWAKAAPLAKDGEMYLNLSKLQIQEERWADAKGSAKQAIAKGVKKPGDAWMIVARAEYGLGDKAAVQQAYREAAKYPETKKTAEAAIRKAGGK